MVDGTGEANPAATTVSRGEQWSLMAKKGNWWGGGGGWYWRIQSCGHNSVQGRAVELDS